LPEDQSRQHCRHCSMRLRFVRLSSSRMHCNTPVNPPALAGCQPKSLFCERLCLWNDTSSIFDNHLVKTEE
jgi:hypothetical protein